jgi:4-hydroxyphenylacetate 3-monooxygenase
MGFRRKATSLGIHYRKVGIVARGAKFETAAAYAKQAFTKPTIANWGDAELSDYAVGFICDLGSPDLKFICRPRQAVV